MNAPSLPVMQSLLRPRIFPSRRKFLRVSCTSVLCGYQQHGFIATAFAISSQDDLHPPPVARIRSLPEPSTEQQVAIDTLLKTRSNIIVDAMAGSGKTTTILHLAQAAPKTKFLVLVYNRKLLIETQERAQSLGLDNIVVYNYHTLGVRFYTPECSTDQGLKRVVEEDMTVISGTRLPDFEVLIMDEQQDLIPIYKKFIDKVIRDKGYATRDRQPSAMQNHLRIFVLGDKRQQIYSFNNADSRFLTMADTRDIFGYVNNQPWVRAEQTYSNRVTKPNADFLNTQLLRTDLGTAPMRAAREIRDDGTSYPRPRYILCDPAKEVVAEVERLLRDGRVNPADILILAPSTRGKSPAKLAANQLALNDIPVYRADSDIVMPSDTVTQGKVLICTYHQSKGIERPICIVLGFDQQYHTYYDKQDELPMVVTNPQYVAATRAVDQLILLHDHNWAPLPYIDLPTIDEISDFIVRKPLVAAPQSPVTAGPATQNRFAVVALCRNLPETIITQCLEKLRVRQILGPVSPIPGPPTEVIDKYGLSESTAAITGTAVPAIFEYSTTGKLTILDQLFTTKYKTPVKWTGHLPKAHVHRLQQLYNKYQSGEELTLSDILYTAHLSTAKIDNDLVCVLAIPPENYDWLTPAYADHIDSTMTYLPRPAHIDNRAKFEVTKSANFPDIKIGNPEKDAEQPGILLTGSMDIYSSKRDRSAVWEVKHTDLLQPEHLIQTALYMLLLQQRQQQLAPRQQPQPHFQTTTSQTKKDIHAYLLSARTGHLVSITPAYENTLHEMLQILVAVKSGGPQARLLSEYSDVEFLEEASRDFDGLVGKCALPKWFSARPGRGRFERRGR